MGWPGEATIKPEGGKPDEVMKKNSANQAYLDLHQSRTMTLFRRRETAILIVVYTVGFTRTDVKETT